MFSTQASQKRARGSGGIGETQPTQKCCRRCGEIGHNTRTYSKVEEEISELDASTIYTFSDDSLA